MVRCGSTIAMRLCPLLLLLNACHSLNSAQQSHIKRQQGGTSLTVLNNSNNEDPLQLSPASIAIQEGARVRRILRQRSTRGKPAGLTEAETSSSPRKTMLTKEHFRAATNKPRAASLSRRATNTRRGPQHQRAPKGLSIPYEITLQGLMVYYEMNSNLVFPRRYVVKDNSSDFPEELHGIDLAGTVYDMTWWNRHVKQRPERVAELNKLGFVWERLQPEWNLVLEALITYRTLKGDLLVPSKFVVPFDDDTWSRATWGLALGNAVNRIRTRGDFLRGNTLLKRRNQLEALGFVWDVQEYLFERFCDALEAYAKLETKEDSDTRKVALKIPSRFVVPESDKWPRELWGYPLGAKCTAVRQKELYIKGNLSRLKRLAEIGFHEGGNDSLSWLEVVHAAAVYSQLNGRNLDVPLKFVVPEPPSNSFDESILTSTSDGDPWPWPEHLWGFPLGLRLRDIRVKGYYLRGDLADARRRQLDALGFNWNPKPGRRKQQVAVDAA